MNFNYLLHFLILQRMRHRRTKGIKGRNLNLFVLAVVMFYSFARNLRYLGFVDFEFRNVLSAQDPLEVAVKLHVPRPRKNF